MKAISILIIVLAFFEVSLAQIDTIWIRRYNSPDHFQDYACDIGVDGSGNVCVTGTSLHGSPSSEDMITLKYSAMGDSIWTVRYDGQWEDDDSPIGLALDMSDNIYVCGYSMGMDATFDYTTIKYNSNGDSLWVRYLNGIWGDNDYPTDFTFDNGGNIYITGITRGPWTCKDYMTVKYNSIGDTMWMKTYDHVASRDDSAAAIAVDDAGCVYITGTSFDYSNMNDYSTVKYDAFGNVLWISRYNGLSDSTDVGIDIAVDDSVYIYVTGASWTVGFGYDIVTIKYNTDGDTLWTRRYNGTGNGDDYPCAIQVDNSGDILVTGYSRESTTDYCIIKYQNDGTQAWVAHYNGANNGIDKARATTIDDSNNIYVTGESQGSGTNYDYATVKYNSAGTEVWSIRYEGYSIDRPNAIVVDSAGFVYVTGESSGGAGAYYDYLTIKYCQGTGIAESKSKTKTSNLLTMNSVFRDHLEIRISIPNKTSATLKVYDANGSLVKDLSSDAASSKIIIWDGRDNNNNILPPGIYFIHLITESEQISQKIIKVN